LLSEDAARNNGMRLASEAATWMIGDVLDNRSRLTAFARESLAGRGPGSAWNVALKTGTSYGLRDAWTAAWTPDFTVVVWVGDPSGAPWYGLVGAQAAAPVALSVLRTLSPRPRWFDRPMGISLREVCSISGTPPTAACLSTRRDWYIEGVSRSVPCSLHVFRSGRSTRLWPIELAMGNIHPSEIQRRPYVTISSPIAGAIYHLTPLGGEQRIPLRAEGAIGRVWWYMNGEYIGTAAPGQAFFHAFPNTDGRHTISVVDEEGRTAVTHVTVVFPGRTTPAYEELL